MNGQREASAVDHDRRHFLALAATGVLAGCGAPPPTAEPTAKPPPPGYDDPVLGCRRVPRVLWGMEPLAPNHAPMGAIERITVHHSGEHSHVTARSDVAVVRGIDRYHRRDRGWAGIGYHFLIGGDGSLFEGRPLWAQGAHVSSANRHNIGISMIGEFSHQPPPAAQLKTLERLLDRLRLEHSLAKNRIAGHGELGTTLCPGAKLQDWLNRYRGETVFTAGPTTGAP